MLKVPYIPELDNCYGRKSYNKKGLNTGERLKTMYREFHDNGATKQEWDVVGSELLDNGKTVFFLCAPAFITRVHLTKAQIKKHIFQKATTQPQYTVDEYRYCRLEFGWDGISSYWGKLNAGEPYIDQISRLAK